MLKHMNSFHILFIDSNMPSYTYHITPSTTSYSILATLPPTLGGCSLMGFFGRKAAIYPLFSPFFAENPLFFAK